MRPSSVLYELYKLDKLYELIALYTKTRDYYIPRFCFNNEVCLFVLDSNFLCQGGEAFFVFFLEIFDVRSSIGNHL